MTTASRRLRLGGHHASHRMVISALGIIVGPVGVGAQTFDQPSLPAPAVICNPQPQTPPCVACDQLFASDCNFGLWRIDPGAGTSTCLGLTSEVLFDVGFTADGRLFGLDPSYNLRELDACTAADTVVAGASGNAMGGLPAGDDLYHVQTPPLWKTTARAPWASAPVGGTLGPTMPPDWCGPTTGDLAYHPVENLFYASLECGCAGDILVTVSPITGEVVQEIGCIRDAVSGSKIPSVLGLAFDSAGVLWGVEGRRSPTILRIDTTTALATSVPISGGFECGLGLASIPCGGCTVDPVPPNQGNVLRAVRAVTSVQLDFAGAPATAWRLYRDDHKTRIGRTPLPPDVSTPTFTDANAVPGPPGLYYLRGLSPCTSSPGP